MCAVRIRAIDINDNMNDKLHCRENCRYHYSLVRDLINSHTNRPNFIIRFITNFMVYLCVVLATIIIYNTYMIREFVNDQKFFNLSVGYIQQIRNYYKLNTTSVLYRPDCTSYYRQDCNALYANKL